MSAFENEIYIMIASFLPFEPFTRFRKTCRRLHRMLGAEPAFCALKNTLPRIENWPAEMSFELSSQIAHNYLTPRVLNRSYAETRIANVTNASQLLDAGIVCMFAIRDAMYLGLFRTKAGRELLATIQKDSVVPFLDRNRRVVRYSAKYLDALRAIAYLAEHGWELEGHVVTIPDLLVRAVTS
jgi:hypothetical protein